LDHILEIDTEHHTAMMQARAGALQVSEAFQPYGLMLPNLDIRPELPNNTWVGIVQVDAHPGYS